MGRKRKLRFTSVVACAFLPLCADSAAPPRTPHEAPWLQTHWQSEEGLPSNTVHAIVQTADGYIWIGTKRGLVRFDGVRFTVFKHPQLAGLRDSSVYALAESADGTLWIGGERGGIATYRKGVFLPYAADTVTAPINGLSIQSIQPSRRFGVLLRAAGQLAALEKGSMTILRPGGSGTELVSAAIEDRAGRLWLSLTKSGLVRSEGQSLSRFSRLPRGAPKHARQIYEDREGRIWLGGNGALVRHDGASFESFRFDRESGFNDVTVMHQDLDGGLWAGVWGRLVRWKHGQFSVIPLGEGGSDNEVLALHADRENNLWVGTRNYGLYRLNAARVFTYSKQEGLSNNSVKSILADSAGRLWVGADIGLNLLEDRRFRAVKGEMARQNVRSLAEDASGAIWAGGWNRICRLTPDGFASISLNQAGLPAQVTTCLLPARDGSLWIGSQMGLLRLNNGKLTRLTVQDGLSSGFVRALIQTRDGAIWAATSHGGVNRLKDGKITSLTVGDGLSSNDIYSLYEDAEGVIWIGTMEQGLCRWRSGSVACFGTADGLFDDGAYQIQEDRRGNLWIGGAGGIYRVAKRELEARARRETAKASYLAFGESDGMLSVECRGGHQPASAATPDGRLWFTTIRGLVVVDPDRIVTNRIPPPVAIEEVRVNGELLSSSASAPLGDGKVEVRYTGLSFTAPTKVGFKYRLAGFDRDWISAGNRRTATYTNVPPGRFLFEVMASNNDGVWTSAATSVAIVLDPPFYRSPWFFSVGAVFATGLIFAMHRVRVNVIESRFAAVLAERTRIAREIHDTVMQGMTGISAQLEAVSGSLSDSPALARTQLDRLRVQARGLVEEARRSIWNLRPGTMDNGNLITALRASARESMEGRFARVHFELSGEHRPLPTLVERNLLMIAREAVSNAVQHGRPESIRIGLRYSLDSVHLVIEDDGTGFDPDMARTPQSRHYGIIGMRERAHQISARFSVTSSAGAGTKVEISVPAHGRRK